MKRTVTKRSLLTSVLSLFLCFAMLLGTTYAWFTDTASSKGNKVQAGTLDVELLMWNGTEYVNISTSEDPIFDSAANANNSTKTLWEPGKTQVAYLAIENKGKLDLKYSVALNVTNITKNLNEVMEYTITPDAKDGAAVAWDASAAQQVVAGIQTVTASDTTLQAAPNGVNIHYFALSIHMMEEAGNEYKGGEITFDLNVLATQVNTEEDAYGPDYDKDVVISPAVSVPANATEPVTMTAPSGVKVTLSAETLNNLPNDVEEISVLHSEPVVENGAVVFPTFEVVDQNGNAVNVEGTVTLPVTTIADNEIVAVYHDEDFMAATTVANGSITYDYTHNSEVKVIVPDAVVDNADDLVTAVANGGYILLTADITIDNQLDVKKDTVLNGAGHTLTYTGNSRAINVTNETTVNLTVEQLTVSVTSGYSQRGINYGNNGELTLKNVTVGGAGITYALNMPGTSNGATVTVINSNLTGCIALNVWGADATVTVVDSVLTSVDKAEHENYSAISLNNDGTTSAENAIITVVGGKVIALDENDEPSVALRNSTLTGKIAVSETTQVTGDSKNPVAAVIYKGYNEFYTNFSLQDAIDKATNDSTATVKLLKDIALEAPVTVSGTVVLDLNGFTLSGVDTTTKNYGLIQNNGTLTINDSVGGGKILLSATINSEWNRYSAVISNNPGGTLVVNGGHIEHFGGTDMAYGIDSLTNGGIGDVSVTINGGTVKSAYRAIRQFLNSDSKKNTLVVNGGTLDGANKAVFFHDPSAKANNGVLTIADAATVKGGVYLFVTEGSTQWPVKVSIAADAEVTSKNVPAGYAVVNDNGTVKVVKTADMLAAGGNIVLASDITLTGTLLVKKDVVLDLNGHTVSANMSQTPLFQSQSNAAPSMTITSSVAGAAINVSGGDTSVILGYGSTEISNVTINVTGCDNYSPNPFNVYGDLTLGEGTVVNVDYLGTSLISNNGAVDIVIDGADINIGTFKTNAGTVISLNQASTLEMKNTDIKIDTYVLSNFGGESLISKVNGVTITDCTFDVTDSNGASRNVEEKNGKYGFVLG